MILDCIVHLIWTWTWSYVLFELHMKMEHVHLLLRKSFHPLLIFCFSSITKNNAHTKSINPICSKSRLLKPLEGAGSRVSIMDQLFLIWIKMVNFTLFKIIKWGSAWDWMKTKPLDMHWMISFVVDWAFLNIGCDDQCGSSHDV